MRKDGPHADREKTLDNAGEMVCIDCAGRRAAERVYEKFMSFVVIPIV